VIKIITFINIFLFYLYAFDQVVYEEYKTTQKTTHNITPPKKGDFIILDDLEVNPTYKKQNKNIVKNQNPPKHLITNKTKKKIKEKNTIQIQRDIKQTKQVKQKPKKHINIYQVFSLQDLLKAYKEKISSGERPNKLIYEELRKRLSKKDPNLYDKLALLNALEDIQKEHIGKYEALLTLDDMIKELR